MATPYKLTFVPYLQRWVPASRTLSIRLLVAPSANPLAPLVNVPAGVPAFADASFAFAVSISDTVGALPQRTLVDQMTVLPDPSAAPATLSSPNARVIFAAIQTSLNIPDTAAADTFAERPRDLARQVRKYLPESYRGSFAFVRPRTSLAVIDDTYLCLMRCPPDPEPPRPPLVVGWGEAMAFAMRQPRLAEALGLVWTLDVPLDAAPRLENGGWLWVDLAPASDYAAQTATAGFSRSFATRVPPLAPTVGRPVFTPVVFPVSETAAAAGALGNFDKVFVEAIRFDDGFAKIVHARQPRSSDTLAEDGDGPPIGRDEGIQLGWDDEDILEGQNRALGAPPDGEDPVLAPRGVFGYRVDVRRAGTSAWTSLSRTSAPLNVGVDLGTAIEERWTEVAPAEHSQQTWLPAWFASWRGESLVAATQDEQRLMNVPVGPAPAVSPVGADAVPLRYGRRYEFRVRLADTTGGGPALGGAPVQIGESPIAMLHMKRHRRPSSVEIDPVIPDGQGLVSAVRARRPRLGYPEAVFAGGAGARSALLAQIAANDAGPLADARPPTVADPDTSFLEIRVLLRLPAFDTAGTDGGYRPWYTTTRRFPVDADQALDLDLAWQDASDVQDVDVSGQLGAEGTISGPLQLVTARDVRLEIRALGRNDLTYFGSEGARRGPPQEIDLHAVAGGASETDVLRPLARADQLRSVLLRPDPAGATAETRAVVGQNEPSGASLGRLAAEVDLVADGSMIAGPPGERVAFGCAGLTHYAAPDGSSLEFSDPAELPGQWINVLQLVVDRDWTWRGAGSPTVEVRRTITLPDSVGATPESVDVGTVQLMNAVNQQATSNADRGHTRIVFLDAFTPRLGADGRPYEMVVEYVLRFHLEGGGAVARAIETRLPIASRPRQVPKVVAAGISLTPYERDASYASTASRVRRLWIEFADPIADPRDAYFVKALATAPDPMLLPGTTPTADPVALPTIPLDPELVRVITPDQVQDLAGLATMQRLSPSPGSDRHFLMPLPPNVDANSPELFSFYTYEIRVGHDRGSAADPLWSTAQGRFGEPLVLEGVQHPVPELSQFVITEPNAAIRVRAPYATPYVGLRRVLPIPPNTEIWAVLYARVVQADAATNRNIQIDLRRLTLPRRRRTSAPLFVEGEVMWTAQEIETALLAAGLPVDSPLGTLAVEVLPEPNASFDDPLGGDLGQVRILRTSPLAAVQRDCCE